LRAEPAPPGGASLAKRPRGVNPGITRRVVFSEGRTLCVRMARLNECRGIPFSPDDEARGLWPTGDMSGPGRCLPCGRAEPAPPRGGRSEVRRPCGGRPENRRRAFFSEGRAPRVRIVRPDEWQAMGLPPVLLREASGRKETTFGLAWCLRRGRAEPAPPRGRPSKLGWPCGEGPGMTRNAVFSEGRGLRAREYGPGANRGMS